MPRPFRLLAACCLIAFISLSCRAQCSGAQTAVISFAAAGDNTVVAAVPNRHILVLQFFIVNNDATTDTSIVLKDGATAKSGAYLLRHGGGSHTAPCTGTPWATTSSGAAFVINNSAAVSITGEVYYLVVP